MTFWKRTFDFLKIQIGANFVGFVKQISPRYFLDKSKGKIYFIFFFSGYYTRITNAEEIKSKVFEYIKVLARPMVLYLRDHPRHWTPVYVGGKVSVQPIFFFFFSPDFVINTHNATCENFIRLMR